MPLYIIDKNEILSYIPDQQAFRNMPPGFGQALRDVIVEIAALPGLPFTIPEELTTASILIDRERQDDAIFYYRRLPSNRRASILSKHSMNGLTDMHMARWDMGAESLTGWKNVRSLDGQDIAFSRDLIPMIPGDIIQSLGVLCEDAAPEDYLKNYASSLNGMSRSTG